MRLVQSTEDWLTKINEGRGDTMPKGKREDGRPSHLESETNGDSTPTQTELPGIEQEKIPALERLIRKYQKAKLDRMEASKFEVESKQSVMKMMHNEGLTIYKRPGHFPFKAALVVKEESLKVEEIDEDEAASEDLDVENDESSGE